MSFPITSPVEIVGTPGVPGQINLTNGMFGVQINAPPGLASDVDFTLPVTVGAIGQILQRSGPTSTAWVTGGGGGGGESPMMFTITQFNKIGATDPDQEFDKALSSSVAGSDEAIMAWKLGKNHDKEISVNFVIPSNYTGGSITVAIYYFIADNGKSDGEINVRVRLSTKSDGQIISSGSDPVDSNDTGDFTISEAGLGTDDLRLKVKSISFTPTSASAGEWAWLGVIRAPIVSGSEYDEDIYLSNITIDFS